MWTYGAFPNSKRRNESIGCELWAQENLSLLYETRKFDIDSFFPNNEEYGLASAMDHILFT